MKHDRQPAPDREPFHKALGYTRAVLFFLPLVVLLGGCQAQQAPAGPTIQFTKIPPAAQGGRERVDTIAGRVTGSHPGQQIVIYARSGPW